VNAVDAIVVGGGPAGSTCAWKLRDAGLDVVVLDRKTFPRTKLCAGWVTPEAITDLELDPQDYPLSFMTFDELHLHWKLLSVKLKSRQHSIRRFEFDDFLLRRSGARVLQHKVREIQRDGTDYVIDGQYRCKYLVGAGGTACPVYRTLFSERNPHSSALQTATFEHEFAYDWEDGRCHLKVATYVSIGASLSTGWRNAGWSATTVLSPKDTAITFAATLMSFVMTTHISSAILSDSRLAICARA
jgi:flavin-dependent dehydrogenase